MIAVAVIVATWAAMPPGWVLRKAPEAGFTGARQCANYTRESLVISLSDGQVAISRERRKHESERTLARTGGRLVGRDGGEWGGTLTWNPTNADPKVLLRENVKALLPLPGDTDALVVTGLSHLGLRYGKVHFARSSPTGLALRKIADLAGPPLVITADSPDTFLVAQDEGIVRLHSDGLVEPVCPLDLFGLGVASMVKAPDGSILLGMSRFVASVVPSAGGQCRADWYVSSDCPNFEVHKLDCVCVVQPAG